MNAYHQDSDPDTDYEDEGYDIYDEVDDIADEEDEEDDLFRFDHGALYIGHYFYDREYNTLLLASTINPRTMFKHSHNAVVKYLHESSLSFLQNPKIDIMQMCISQDIRVFSVIVKTYWLKIVQRCWKNTFKQRIEVIEKQKSPKSLWFREIHGRFPRGCDVLPELRGMLSFIKSSKYSKSFECKQVQKLVNIS